LLVVIKPLTAKSIAHAKQKENEQAGNNGKLNGIMKSLSTLVSTGDKDSVGYYSLLSMTTSSMICRIAEMSIEQFKPDILINIPHDSAKTFEFYKANELIEMGKKAAKKALTESKILNPNKK